MGFDISKIKNKEDRALISDAIKLCENGFYRASYIMAWLSCAESLKRRFYELGKRDSNAGKLYKNIEELEKQHKSVDNEIINGAFNFNLISDTEKEKLKHFFSMRSVYSHPYEEAPSKVDCEQIIENIIQIVLSRPVLLKEGGISFILDRLTKEESFLNNSSTEINTYSKELISIIDPKKYSYFLKKYLQFLNDTPKDQRKGILYNRGIMILSYMAFNIGIENIWSNEEFENILYTYRNASLNVFAELNIFLLLDQKFKNIIINRLFEDIPDNLSLIKYLDSFYIKNILTENQRRKFSFIVFDINWRDLPSIELSLKALYPRIISGLKSHNWHMQNPACEYIIHFGSFDDTLSDEEYVELGRNILQSYVGGSSGAHSLLYRISTVGNTPISLIQGIVEECFYDDNKKLRLKISNPQLIEQIIDKNLSFEEQENLFLEIATNIQQTEIKRNWDWSEYDQIPDTGLLGKIKKVLNENYPVFPF
ncbi:MAG: hypothetical protein IKV03_01395 [Alphaproteobacteria bacterium]|nr:hypothetical protein [Alphaproteobacteria bacterium]